MRPTVTFELAAAPKTAAGATMENEVANAVVARNWRRGTAGEAVLGEGADAGESIAFITLCFGWGECRSGFSQCKPQRAGGVGPGGICTVPPEADRPNPKPEIRNPKQAQIPNGPMTETSQARVVFAISPY